MHKICRGIFSKQTAPIKVLEKILDAFEALLVLRP